jgi:hypothetical protein
MYEHPSIHLELARQRHEHFLAVAEQQRLAKLARAERNGSERLASARGRLAGVLGTLTNVMSKKRPALARPGLEQSC